MRRTSTILIVVLLLAALAGPARAQSTVDSARISGQVGDPTIDPAAEVAPGAWLRHTGRPAPDGYSHAYQWDSRRIVTASPEDGAVTMAGTLDLSQRVVGSTAMLGLYDLDGLASGDHGYQTGAYVYIRTRADGVVIFGPSDGNSGGEIVQRFIANADITGPIDFSFVVDGTADPASCASSPADVASADGCLSLSIAGMAPIVDSYGSITTPGEPDEFATGAVPGWDSFIDGGSFGPTGVVYDVIVSPLAVFDPTQADDCKDGRWADYGFSNQGQCIRFVNTGKDSR